MVCGEGGKYPVYRTGSDLTRFFSRAGVPRFVHDGTTRKWWTLHSLQNCTGPELQRVLLRLASPKEYGGNKAQVDHAFANLNEILQVEGLEVYLDGVEPKLRRVEAGLREEPPAEEELKPLPPPDFGKLGLDPNIARVLALRWEEADRCVKSRAYLAATITMGSLLEGMLLAVCQANPRQANQSQACPKHPQTGKPKQFHEWKLGELIDVAHAEKWVDLDVKKFSHALREFRNLIHPFQQMVEQVFPDEDTCNICWRVVQAATNDLARVLK